MVGVTVTKVSVLSTVAPSFHLKAPKVAPDTDKVTDCPKQIVGLAGDMVKVGMVSVYLRARASS